MKRFLLLDFGATRVKSAITNVDDGSISHIKDFPALQNCSKTQNHHEISLNDLKEQFLSICSLYYNQLEIKFEGIVICSQMHGFAVLDKNNNPVTEYISWKDERSLEIVDNTNTFSLITEQITGFKKITGMIPRPGLPFMNLIHFAKLSSYSNDYKIITIPDWLSLSSNDSTQISHETMIAGLGFYDINKKQLSEELIYTAKELAHIDIYTNDITQNITVSGYWHVESKKIPIYTGVGDHQCAVLGAYNIPEETISINIGTGSQIAVIDKKVLTAELRPYFDSSRLATITHIPAGRVISEFLRFIEDICKNCTNQEIDSWKIMANLEKNEILNSTLYFDLATFNSAWNYKGGGSISGISGNNLNLKNYLTSLIRCFTEQFLSVIKIIDPKQELETCIISGGIPKRLPVLAEIISDKSGYNVISTANIDETLIGLRTLALVAAGYAPNYLEAQKVYKQGINVTENNHLCL